MNIKFDDNKRAVKIEDLIEGNTFIISEEIGYSSPDIFMVIDEPRQLFEKKTGHNYGKYAVNLENGRVIGFYNDDNAILVDCNLTATIK